MKTRLGYVSNSSSSSFCIVGIVTELDGDFKQDKDDSDYDYDFVERICKNLDFHRGIYDYSEDRWIIGKSIKSMKDDETLASFKKRIFQELVKSGFTGGEDHIGIRIDGGYEG